MFRQMLKLAVEAAKVEVARWRNPGAVSYTHLTLPTN